MPKSGEHDDQMAPRLAVASIAMSGFRQIRQIARHAIARRDARRLQPGGDARDFVVQLAIGQLAPRAAFVAEHDRGLLDRGSAAGSRRS